MASQKAGSTAPSRLEGQGAAAAGKRVSNRALAARTRLGTTVSDTHAFASTGLPLEAVNAAQRRHAVSPTDAVLTV